MELVAKEIKKKIQNKTILDSIHLQLYGGNVYGFTGANGSGKTMLFRALSGLISLDSGTITFDGEILRKDISVLPSLGIILENVHLYPELTGYQNLEYLAGLKNQIGKEEIVNALERVGLDPKDRRTYKKYSFGMKQRLAIAQAIMEKPDVLMLDEPTNALDQDGILRIRNIIIDEKERGAMILLASHNLNELAILADHIYEMQDGKIVRERVR